MSLVPLVGGGLFVRTPNDLEDVNLASIRETSPPARSALVQHWVQVVRRSW